MQKIYKCIIVGGGSAGLLSAVELLSGNDCLNGGDLLILERNDRVGKKLIATGNGQGNLCNENFSSEFYHGDKEFINTFVSLAKKLDVSSYLTNLGIPLTTGKEGRMYPLSKQASAVLDVLRKFIASKGCAEITNAKVESVKKTDKYFVVKTQTDTFYSQNVILATGGMSAKQFGTDGTSYQLACDLGHEKTKLFPSLVQLKTDTSLIKGLKGLKETVRLTAVKNGKVIKSCCGEVLFTEYGVSGNAVFQISGSVVNEEGVELNLEFLPELSVEEITNILSVREKIKIFEREDYLTGIVNKKIGLAVMKTVKNVSPLSVAKALKNFKLALTGNLGFNYSQVTKGGIKTDKINPFTMESKLARGCYLVGELLNLDGDCGGYNLTFAFVSGILSAKAIKEKFTN